ncbi:MAG: glycosyltransferase family 4 protein [bacterium]|nr:glycosyltransferase family 4 protein [bacterium]
MKVVFLTDDFPPTSFGGAGISTYGLARGVARDGHAVSIITTCRKEGEAGESKYEGLTVFRIQSAYHERWRAWLGVYNPPVVHQVKGLLSRLRPDAVHANNVHYHLSWASLKVAKQYAKRVVWTARDAMAFSYGKLDTPRYLETLDARLSWRDNLRQAGKRYNPLRNYIIKKYLGYVDLKCAVSSALAHALEQNGIPDVEAMHTGIDVEAWQASEERVAEFRAKHALGGKKVCLFGGRLSGGKGGFQVLEALALVAKKMPDAVLLVAGTAEGYAGGMQKRAGELGVGARIVFTGWVFGDDLHAAYGASDVVLVPSLYLDPLPRIVLEAMASGRPVVGSRYGGSPEAIVDGVTGYIVDPRHAEHIAGKTLELLRHPEKVVAFGRAGQERIRTHFNLDEVVGWYVGHYRARQ